MHPMDSKELFEHQEKSGHSNFTLKYLQSE